jgi:hypothetical protein
VDGYYVTRIKNSDNSTAPACGSSAASLKTTTSCSDTSVPDGTYHYTVTAVFRSWTAAASSGNVSVSNDATASTSSASLSPAANLAGWNNTSPVTVTLSATDNTGGTGVKELRYTTDGSAPTASSTLYTTAFTVSSTTTVKFFAVDNAGNVEPYNTRNVKIDTAPPTGGALTANGSSSDSFNTTGTIALGATSFTDTNSGLAAGANAITRASASLSGNVCGTFSGATSVTIGASGNDSASLSTGCYRYTLSAADAAGNTATPATSAVVKVDTSAPATPSLAFSGLSANAFYDSGANTLFIRPSTGGTFTVTASSSDSDTGIQGYSFGTLNSNGGSNFVGSQAGSRFDYTFGATTTAPTTARTVSATNNAGGASNVTYSLVTDTQAPSGGALTINGAATDSFSTTGVVAVTRTNFADAGSGLAAGSNGVTRASATLINGVCGSFSAPVAVTLDASNNDSTTLGNGCYRYTLDASDKVGNAAITVTSATVKVDRSAPSGTVTSPSAGILGGTVSVTSTTAQDTGGSGLASVLFQVAPNGSSTFSDIGTAVTASPYSTAWDTTGLTNGSYNVRAIITDAAGNSTTTALVAVTVNNGLTVSGPSKPTAGTAFDLTLTARATNATTTNTAFNGSKTVTFSGPSTALSGTDPTYPATVNFVNGIGTASVTLYKAEATSVTATLTGSLVGTSGGITVNGNSAPGGLVLTTSSQTLSCTTSVFQCSLQLARGGSAWTSKVSVTDDWGNAGPAKVTANAGLAVTVSRTATNGALTGTSLTIGKNASETSAPFSYTPGSSNYNDSVTAAASGLTSAVTSLQIR